MKVSFWMIVIVLAAACFGPFGPPVSFNYFVWLRITDEGSLLEMRIWSILLIKSDLKWCIHLSRSLFLYSKYVKLPDIWALTISSQFTIVHKCILFEFGVFGVYWCFTSHATLFQSYMWRHRCAGGLKKLYLRSVSHRHRHFAGLFNVPVLHRHGTTLFIRWFRHTAPIAFYGTLGIRRTYSRLKPPA